MCEKKFGQCLQVWDLFPEHILTHRLEPFFQFLTQFLLSLPCLWELSGPTTTSLTPQLCLFSSYLLGASLGISSLLPAPLRIPLLGSEP